MPSRRRDVVDHRVDAADIWKRRVELDLAALRNVDQEEPGSVLARQALHLAEQTRGDGVARHVVEVDRWRRPVLAFVVRLAGEASLQQLHLELHERVCAAVLPEELPHRIDHRQGGLVARTQVAVDQLEVGPTTLPGADVVGQVVHVEHQHHRIVHTRGQLPLEQQVLLRGAEAGNTPVVHGDRGGQSGLQQSP